MKMLDVKVDGFFVIDGQRYKRISASTIQPINAEGLAVGPAEPLFPDYPVQPDRVMQGTGDVFIEPRTGAPTVPAPVSLSVAIAPDSTAEPSTAPQPYTAPLDEARQWRILVSKKVLGGEVSRYLDVVSNMPPVWIHENLVAIVEVVGGIRQPFEAALCPPDR